MFEAWVTVIRLYRFFSRTLKQMMNRMLKYVVTSSSPILSSSLYLSYSAAISTPMNEYQACYDSCSANRDSIGKEQNK